MIFNGKRILLGRHQTGSSPLERRLQQEGALVSCVPLIEVHPITSIKTTNLNRNIDWVVITSRNSLDGYEKVRPRLTNHRLAVVGKRTGDACRQRGLIPQVEGAGKGALALLYQMSDQYGISGTQILYPCSNLVGSEFKEAAIAQGAMVHMLPVYRTEMPSTLTIDALSNFHVAVFYSSSGAHHFNVLLPFSAVTNLAAVAMGEQTANTLRNLGAKKVYQAQNPNADALFDAVVECLIKEAQSREGEDK